ncbi:hypothetical protein MSAN_00902700 [Mycena sanguinolenta]|uniref:HIT-type domain-containing protein n=1 Tax=Mycena sanguinolenta TaxID=230812 RepID=A0A8H6YWZ7_9AGAR|nr:hypothetical protein MSAN_00902700 [Mycena sanguinolenta]
MNGRALSPSMPTWTPEIARPISRLWKEGKKREIANQSYVSQFGTMSSAETITCRLCRRQFSKYTCPTCNIPYCSLTCFRSPAHAQCSETFYKKEVESDIRAAPDKTREERRRMMEVLKRFEEESAAQDGDELHIEEDEDENDLARRMQNVDLDSTSSDQLWTLLTPAEREKFLKAMRDPQGALAVQLLASAELEAELKQEPWWARPPEPDDSPPAPGRRPEPLQVPPIPDWDAGFWSDGTVAHIQYLRRMVRPPFHLILPCSNFAGSIAYAYATRHHASRRSPLPPPCPPPADDDDDADAARALLGTLTPFLVARNSKEVHPTLENALAGVQSRLPADTVTPHLVALLLRDAATLLRPALIVDASNAHAHTRHENALRALGDMHALFRQPHAPVKHKIVFYAAHIVAGGGGAVWSVVKELELEAAVREKEAEVDSRAGKREWERVRIKEGGEGGAGIVELGTES